MFLQKNGTGISLPYAGFCQVDFGFANLTFICDFKFFFRDAAIYMIFLNLKKKRIKTTNIEILNPMMGCCQCTI